jgi:hypothetical protein
MSNYFLDIRTKLNHISKTINGYTIYRSDSNNKYQLNLNLFTNQIEIKRSV